MAEKIKIRLDDVIKSNNRCCGDGDGEKRRREWQYPQRRNIYKNVASDGVQKGRGRGGITKTYSRGYMNSGWKHNPSEWYTPRKISGSRTMAEDNSGHAKLIISNLDSRVSDSDMQELFEEFRPLKSTVHYDRSGMSLGSADVIFERRSEAIRAMDQYNRICLDGRPMNIQLTTSEFPSLVRNTTVRVGKTFEYGSPRGAQKTRNTSVGRPAERKRNPRNQKKPPTAEELDAELEAYARERKKIENRSKIFENQRYLSFVII